MSKIAFLCHPYHRGGVTTWMVSAAVQAARQGVDVYFITINPKYFVSGGDRPTMLQLLHPYKEKLNIVSCDASFEFELGTPLYRSQVYRRLLQKHIPAGTSVVVSDDEAVWEGAASIAHKYPMIGVLHSDDPTYYYLATRFMKYVSRFVSVSNRIANRLKELSGLDSKVIPCGIDVKEFEGEHKDQKSTFKICWIGRLEEEQKRVSDILKIASLLKNKGIDFIMYIAGTGPEQSLLRTKAQEEGLQSQVQLLGWCSADQVKTYLLNCDCLLQTSNFEGMSVAVMEALSSGSGVVSSRVSGVEDYESITGAEQCLFLYQIGEIMEAVEKLLLCRQVPSLERVLAARRFASEHFSISSCVSRYLSITDNAVPVKVSLDVPYSASRIMIYSYLLAFARKSKYMFMRLSKLTGS